MKLLDAELETLMLAKASNHGVPPEWVDRLLAADPVRRQALTVASTVAATGAHRVLEGGDILLTVGCGCPTRCSFNIPGLTAPWIFHHHHHHHRPPPP